MERDGRGILRATRYVLEEFHVMVLTFASSSSLPIASYALANAAMLGGSAANFSCFNPALLATPLWHSTARKSHADNDNCAALLLFFRVSNMHFCPGSGRESWRDSVRQHTHIRSYLAAARMEAVASAGWPPTLLSDPQIMEDATNLFRSEGSTCRHRIDVGNGAHGTFSGPEDPRPFWSPEPLPVPWLLVSAWSDDCRRLGMHLVKLPANAYPHELYLRKKTTTAPTPPATSEGPSTASQLPLTVSSWPERASPALAHPEAQAVQKNWLPFVTSRGELLVVYSIEPHVLLHVDPHTGRCEPLHTGEAIIGGGGGPFASFPPLARLAASVGRVSGGAPPIWLPAHRLYLGLGHVKDERAAPQHIGTAYMVYRHVFYAFRDAFPYAVVAAGTPFVLPEPALQSSSADKKVVNEPTAGSTYPTHPRNGTTVQFAAGMALSPDGGDLLVSYSTLDCGVRLARLSLEDVLADLSIVW